MWAGKNLVINWLETYFTIRTKALTVPTDTSTSSSMCSSLNSTTLMKGIYLCKPFINKEKLTNFNSHSFLQALFSNHIILTFNFFNLSVAKNRICKERKFLDKENCWSTIMQSWCLIKWWNHNFTKTCQYIFHLI